MNIRLLVMFSMLLVACRGRKPESTFSVPAKKEINEIVKTIILKNGLNHTKQPLSADLTKVEIGSKNSDKLVPSIKSFRMGINELLRNKNDSNYFNKEDSLNLVFQNTSVKAFKLDNFFLKIIKLTNNLEIQKHQELDEFYGHYEMTLPIFSLNRKKAVVLLSNFCPLCGYGMLVYLKKINNKWMVFNQVQTWVS